MRTKEQWLAVFETITGGYVPQGGVQHLYQDVIFRKNDLVRNGVIKEGDRILDVGCANGGLAMALTDMNVHYTGIDCVGEAIAFCKKAFKDYPQYTFKHIDICNEQYNPEGTLLPTAENIRFPDGPFDAVISSSLYTHLETVPVCALYIAETKRVLKQGGKFFSTWFRSPPHPLQYEATKTTLHTSDIMHLLEDFTIDTTRGGHSEEYHDQWIVYATYLPSSRQHVDTLGKTVLQIVGVSFSGSSLLEVLLNSQSNIFALGEAHCVYANKMDIFRCRFCNVFFREHCSFFCDFDKNQRKSSSFYQYCFERSKLPVLVDNSKSFAKYCLVRDERYCSIGVFVSKTPHEAAFSNMCHHPGCHTLVEYVETYIQDYQRNRDVFAFWNCPIRQIPYRTLVSSPKKIVQVLCTDCGIPYEDFSTSEAMMEPKSHVLLGNMSIYNQQVGRIHFFEQGKYKGRRGQIFLDEEWKKDSQFIAEFLEVYRTKEKELEPVLAFLGQPDVATLVHELEMVQKGSMVLTG